MEVDFNCGTPIEKKWPQDKIRIISECLFMGVLSPFERLINLKILTGGKMKARECISLIKQHEGRAGLWRGASTNMMVYMSYLIYTKAKLTKDAKYHCQEITDPNNLSSVRKSIYSPIFLFSIFAIPIHVIKVNLAPIRMNKLIDGKIEPPKNVYDCLSKIVKNEGI